MRQSTEAFGRISCPWYVRAVCTWNFGAFSLHLVSVSHLLVVWVLLGVQRIAFLGRVCGLGAMPGSTGDTCSATVLAFFERIVHNFYVEMDSHPGVFLLYHAEW